MQVLSREQRTERIRELNDAFRTTFAALPDMVKAAALQKAAQFDDFNDDNDPYGEHDFGSFELCNRKFFWKIDYYDPGMEQGSDDPSDPEKTARVMTLMLAEEY